MATFFSVDPKSYGSFPEYQFDGLWGCVIEDYENTVVNSIKVGDYMPSGFDNYVQSVSIPQISLEGETTPYGLINFTNKAPYDDATITFYDDIQGSCFGFFLDWIHCIYDEEANCLKQTWRSEIKDIYVEYYRKFYNGKTPVVRSVARYELRKCLPKSISEISAEDSEGGERKTFSVVLAVQRVNVSTNKSTVTNAVRSVDTRISAPTQVDTSVTGASVIKVKSGS